MRFTLRAARYYVVASKRSKMFILLLPLTLEWWTRCISDWWYSVFVNKTLTSINILNLVKNSSRVLRCDAFWSWHDRMNETKFLLFILIVLLFVGFYGHLHLLLITGQPTNALNARITSIDCNKFCVANACMQVCLIVGRDLIAISARCAIAIVTIDYRNDKVMVVVSMWTNVLPIRLTFTNN